MDQTLIVCNPDDRLVGYAPRSACHRGNGILHRAIAAVVMDRDERILLQKRKSALWDGYWDITGATHPLHLAAQDETYEQAAKRCLAVEWGIRIPLRRAFAFTYFARQSEHCEREHCVLLLGTHAGPVQFNPDYAYDGRWVSLSACLEHLRREPGSFTPWAQLAIDGIVSKRMMVDEGIDATVS